MYAPMILTLHLCATFGALAHLAVRSPVVFRVVQTGMLMLAAAVALSSPLFAVVLLLPALAADRLLFRVPDRLDVRSLFPSG